nr:uncharacterized protein LOC114924512 [Arachis hypogaea]
MAQPILPSVTVNTLEDQSNSNEEDVFESKKVRKKVPIGQAFVSNADLSRPPSIFILVDQEYYPDEDVENHSYEFDDLQSLASESDGEVSVFSQGNVDVPVRQIRLELKMEFETLTQLKKVRKFNINLERNIFFQMIYSEGCKDICDDENCLWQIYCAKRSFSASYQVKTFINEHICKRNMHCKLLMGSGW